MFHFEEIAPIHDSLVVSSALQPSMLFELSVVRAEAILSGNENPDWPTYLDVAVKRQSRHFDAKIPSALYENDVEIAELAARNLVTMLRGIERQNQPHQLSSNPFVPGLGWIASGVGDFALGNILIEVKHTDRNFIAGDFRQVLIYWILKYVSYLERDDEVWTDFILINPRRNSALSLNFDYLIKAASPNLSRLEIYEQFRSIVGGEAETRL
ncbi:hypothetical protein [Sphingopyxis sp. 22461]|uniref:hypothetical protein n=1 Tax=Sphingopyxis sp. 22461 TaxID=3453923 RepID=UPI003F8696C2